MKKILIYLITFSAIKSYSQDYKQLPFWNNKLSMDQRVNDLVSRLTLEEKAAQMINSTPAIARLGIPAYDWWNETLHGIARTPFHVTSYPQAIGMAATWDTNSLNQMADFSALEGRAVHNKAIEMNRQNERYLGLTYWTPNINIFRDPRWGRGQETYGEDPFLTAMLGKAFVRGLQGDDPKYLKAAACAKHYAVHSGPEPTRHVDNVTPTAYDLWDTYLPAFKELVTKANVVGVMCAYNAINTQPCCGSDLLMTDILRNQWNFTGYVTSDCGGLDDFFRYHKTHPDAKSSGIDALIHGTDVECGNSVYTTLVSSVKAGLLKESQLDVSLKRLFMIRFRLGMFDPVEMVKYAQTPSSTLEAPEHKALALKMAQQSIVLLKNEHQILPLKKSIKKIAVIGPNADNKIAVLGNYNGTPTEVITMLTGIKRKLGKDVEVTYEKAINYTNDTLIQYDDIAANYNFNNQKGVQAEYFNNQKLEGKPAFVGIEKDIDHYWAEGQTPAAGIGTIEYSGRYTTTLTAPKDEIINFESEADDGYRVFINDSLIVDAWKKNNRGVKQFKYAVQKNSQYKIVVEFYQFDGNAAIRLKAGHYVKTDFNALKERIKDADAIVFVGGISPQLEGEEMPVAIPGFKGGDRTSIMLPAVQTELLKTLNSIGKPLVFVMMTGSAIATPWESEHIPAIVNGWYGGQSAGAAMADVLFGDYNPAGRLPVTFYKSDADLPGFSDYSMEGRTYRYFKGEALYPFGYGLSYSTFKYEQLKMPATVQKGKNITVQIKVTNTGKMDGEEVVELYVSHQNKIIKAPIRALKGFKRIELKKGENKIISFSLTADQLSLVSENGNLIQPADKILVSVGGGQPDIKNLTTSNVVTGIVSVR